MFRTLAQQQQQQLQRNMGVESTKRLYKNVQTFNVGFIKSNQTTATANVKVTLFTSPR